MTTRRWRRDWTALRGWICDLDVDVIATIEEEAHGFEWEIFGLGAVTQGVSLTRAEAEAQVELELKIAREGAG